MSVKENIVERILAAKLISIIRLKERSTVELTVDALVAGGISVLEITTNTPNFADEIKKARQRYPHVLIGAGTVMNADSAQKAIAGGAQFLVTPNTDKEVAKIGNTSDIPVLMGAMTPTEIVNALAYGADIIKLFPAANLGISYFRSLKGPFDKQLFFAVGGISQDNIKDWFDAGIDGVGLGSSLIASDLNPDSNFATVTILAEKFMNSIAIDNG